ncbi:MAG TPA: DUF2855 family protein [Albitalea sp.]|nr:DUF2855 family protein [Albitalea sp.]
MTAHSFIVERKNLRNTRWIEDDAAKARLADGQVRLRIANFALTSNNITYAAFGDAMHYWDFFPTAVEGFGSIPVWGFADVVESKADGVAVGDRIYGYYPIATHAVLKPARINDAGFIDGAAHRSELHAVYNQYTRSASVPGYSREREAEIALLRPLFVTSFLIDDFLADNAFFGARSVVLSSASSKTAYGTAFCLALRRGGADTANVIGLTSAANLAYTQGLGCYDEVVSYDALRGLPPDTPTVYVDFSGSTDVRAAVHGHFNDMLMYSCSVGGTHWDHLGGGKGLPGPRPVLFFAPAQIKKRSAEWGTAGLMERIGAAWTAFMEPVTRRDSPWLTVVRGQGEQDLQRTYFELLDGRLPPQQGHVLSL